MCGGKNVFETRGCALLRKFGIFDRAETHGNFVPQRRYRKCRRNAAVIAFISHGTQAPDSAVCTTEIVFNVPIIYHVTFFVGFCCDRNDEDQCLVAVAFTELEHLVVDSRIRRLRKSNEGRIV